MPEEEKIKSSEKQVDLDTSGPEVDVVLEESKEEVVDTAPETKEQETIEEVKTEEDKKEDDSKLEEYSKGVQSRIAKLTRKMREAERREAAALQYADSLEKKRKLDASRLAEVNTEYTTKLEENVTSAMESAQNELRMAIEAQDATLQVTANKKIAALALENANLQMRKKQKPVEQETPVQLSDGGRLPEQTPRSLPEADPQAEDWAAKNRWFGQDRAMTFTAFEIHKDLVDKEGIDPKSDEYYTEIDKRIRVDFPHKFDNNETIATTKPVQSVASANRSVKTGRKQVRLTSSQVAIAKKLGVPLEEYAKQLKLTEGA
jgi:uncharacterized protein YcbK (DUF882 family)